MNDAIKILKALSNENRLLILAWLKAPMEHFPPQVDGDLLKDGVCSGAIADKLGVSHPAISVHLRMLSEAGLVHPKKIKGWVFYKRDDAAIQRAFADLSNSI